MLRLKNLPIAHDRPSGSGQGQGQGQGQGIGIGLLNKSYWTLLIDKEGDVYKSKAKFIPGAKIQINPINLPPATFKCKPTATEAWQRDEEKLYLCKE